MVIARAFLVSLSSMAASLALMMVVVPMLGGTINHFNILLAITCTAMVALPSSVIGGFQRQRLVRDIKATHGRHAELVSAYEALGERVRRDEMTGTLHRESFFRTVGDLIHEPGGALIIIDADDFRSINERFGHQSGDDVLLQISDALHRAAGKTDILGRIGSEEFAIFLNDARNGEARELAERICEEIHRAKLVSRDMQDIQISVSIGVALTGRGASMEGLLQTASHCMQEARLLGRNRIGYDCELPIAA